MKHKTKKLGIILCSVGIAVIVVFSVFLNYLALTTFDTLFRQFFKTSEDKVVSSESAGEVNVDYYESDFKDAAALYDYEERKVAEMAMEGATLLENDGLLPLAKGTELSLFSHSSVDLVSGGSGSGSGSFELTADLKTGLEAAGLEVNETLWNFYKSGNGSGYKRGAGSIEYGRRLDWKINECPVEKITAESGLADTFKGTVAMFVMSRTGGEGADLARDMKAYGGESGQHYLEPDKTEMGVIDYLNKNFDDVIILVNANNAMELGWIDDYENISAVINFPGAGRTGTYGLGYMLTGLDADGNEISASGHLVDTLVYDNFSSPAMQNMGDYRYTGSDYYYVNYAEGIYVGYKYYETRYEDVVTERANAGSYDYASTVQYPFGYGLSYTDFTWSDFELSPVDPETGEMTVTLEVANSADGRRGKEVVQIYLQSPYTTGEVEKASVQLVGFAKTDYIEPGESVPVTITLDLKDFVSYNDEFDNGDGTKGAYVLDDGDYYITAASDAHKALNNILAARGVDEGKLVAAGGLDAEENAADEGMVGVYTQEREDSETYSVGKDGEAIVNQFAEYSTLADAKYLSRENWQAMDNDGLRYGTASSADSGAEIGGKQWQHELSAALKAKLDSRASLNPEEGKEEYKKHTYGADNGLELIDMRGLDYDDPLWDKLLDQVTVAELSKLIDQAGYTTVEMKSIVKPEVTDLDGPAGINLVVGHGSVPTGKDENGKQLYSMTWPSEYLLASTWNAQLAFDMGRGIAEDGLYGDVQGWYGPAVNIHRTPFAGRNFEYYSEDAFLSGKLGYQAVNGAATKGMYAFLKHFALNDQETHRDHLGIVTWADEQTIREIYLKAFELVIVDNNVTINYNKGTQNEDGTTTYTFTTVEVPAATAIMSSYNRIGPTWAGGNYDLITEVLRGEWGFNGFVLTDYEVATYMFNDQCLAAGGDAKLKTVDLDGNFIQGYNLADHPQDMYFSREAAHHILYTVVHSNAMNDFIHGAKYIPGFAYYKIILIVWDVLAAAGVGVLIFFIVKKVRNNIAISNQAG